MGILVHKTMQLRRGEPRWGEDVRDSKEWQHLMRSTCAGDGCGKPLQMTLRRYYSHGNFCSKCIRVANELWSGFYKKELGGVEPSFVKIVIRTFK